MFSVDCQTAIRGKPTYPRHRILCVNITVGFWFDNDLVLGSFDLELFVLAKGVMGVAKGEQEMAKQLKKGKVTRSMAVAFVLLAYLVSGAWAQAGPGITDVRIGDRLGATRLVLDLDQKISYTIFALGDPARIVVDLPAVAWRAQYASGQGRGVISGYRFGLYAPNASRLVIDLDRPALVTQTFLIPGDGGAPHRLVVDLAPSDRARFNTSLRTPFPQSPPPGEMVQEAAAASVPAPPQPPQQRASAQPAPTAPLGGVRVADGSAYFPLPPAPPASRLAGVRKRVVVIDPGHGGADPGAIGLSGIHEKNITLAVSKAIAKRLEATNRYEVVLTRKKDKFIRLRHRVAKARAAGGELFLSIHADTIRNSQVRGASVYTLSEHASDKEAAQLAERENKADLIAGMDLTGETPEVTNILIELAQRETMNQSARFAQLLVGELRNETQTLNKSHRFAGFAVLKAPDIPSVLIELGFLSNPNDEKNLRTRQYQAKLANGIVRAVDRYFVNIEQAQRQ